jgi:DnaJ-class molecular chaperone
MHIKAFKQCKECKGTGRTIFRNFEVKCYECGGTGEIEVPIEIRILDDQIIVKRVENE